MTRRDNLVKEKSFCFAVRIVRLSQYLRKQQNEHIRGEAADRLDEKCDELVRLLTSIVKTSKEK